MSDINEAADFYAKRDAEQAALAAWLAGLSVGDEVIVVGAGWGAMYALRTVTAARKAYVTVGERNFSRKDGHQTGDRGFSGAYIEPPTDEKRAKITAAMERGRLLNRIGAARWRDLDTATLRAVAAALDAAEAQTREEGAGREGSAKGTE